MAQKIFEGTQKNKESLNKAVRIYRIIIRISITLIALLFLRNLFSKLPFPDIRSLESFVVLKISFVFYLYCWFFGTNRDLSVQNDLFKSAPKPTIKEIGIIAVLVIGCSLLFYLENQFYISVIFVIFIGTNIVGWVWLKKLTKPLVDESLTAYKNNCDLKGTVKINIFVEYMFGKWQWHRFIVGILLLISLIPMSLGLFPTPIGIEKNLAFSLMILLIILILESWIWYKRFILKVLWEGLDWLESKGFLNKKIFKAD